jgi:hypothetical protein
MVYPLPHSLFLLLLSPPQGRTRGDPSQSPPSAAPEQIWSGKMFLAISAAMSSGILPPIPSCFAGSIHACFRAMSWSSW